MSETYEHLRARAVALRREGLSRRQIRDRLGVHNNDLLNRLVTGEPHPPGPAAPTPRTTSAHAPANSASRA